MKQPKAKSSIIYNGPSMIDGKPIICAAVIQSNNAKTGNMLQTYILRSDVSPMDASKSGEDFSICGECVHRGQAHSLDKPKQALNRTCYVTMYHGPTQVYKAFQRGIYPVASDIKAIGSGRMVRLGTYGDPRAIPQSVWDNLLGDSLGHTGYTHQHGISSDYSQVMYSADNKQDAINAHDKGYRTFRVIPVKEYIKGDSLLQNEILCPASKEQDYKTTCDKCKLCSGNTVKAKSIAIVAHGTSRNKVK
jgi:hypothetical protein